MTDFEQLVFRVWRGLLLGSLSREQIKEQCLSEGIPADQVEMALLKAERSPILARKR
jgi:hypothetical protein